MTANRIQTWLEAGGISWRQPIAWFAEHHGVTTCQWLDVPVILMDDAAGILPGLLRPLSFQTSERWAPSMPPVHLWAMVHVSDDWADNLAAVYAALAGPLGTPMPDDTSNTNGWRWTEGAAEVSAICFPPDLQPPFRNSMHEIDPRTRIACSVSIATGFRPVCSPEELDALAGFTPVAAPAGAWLERLRGGQYDLEYVRARPGGTDLPTGLGRAGDYVVAAADELYVLPTAELIALSLGRAHPARGGGRSEAALRCRSAAAGGLEKQLVIARSGHTAGLDDWAREAAARLGVPLAIEDYYDE